MAKRIVVQAKAGTLSPKYAANYDTGVPSSLEYPRVPLHALLDDAAENYPNSTATIFFNAKRSYASLMKDAKRRIQFGKPIAVNQAIQWMLADSAVEIHAARLMVYDAAAKLDSGKRASTEAAMVKVYASEMAGRVVDRVLQIFGGMGYMKGSPVERAYRDTRILRIYEGTSEVQRMIIAEELLKS